MKPILPALICLIGTLSATAVAKTKSLVTPDNFTWVYDHIPAHANRPTVLLLHGFPSSRQDWDHQVKDLSSVGYGVLVPDLLGYGDSDKPTAPHHYRLKALAEDLDAIIDHEGLDTVVGVGHDWGSNVLSHAAVYFPQRFEKLAFLSVGYNPPGFLDIDGINAQGLQTWGYTPFGYWYFFNSYDAADLIRQNIDSAWHLIFPFENSLWRDNLASIGGTRAWLNNENTTERASYRSRADKAAWIKHFSQPGNLESALNTYRSQLRGIQAADAATVTEEQKILNVPVLGVESAQDVVARPEFLGSGTKPYASKGYTENSLDAGHWLMFEKPNELSRTLVDFAARGTEY